MDEKQSICDVCLENECRKCKLPCGHVCCIKCIKESIKIDEDGSYECPSCFESFKAPIDDFESWIQKEQEDTGQTEIAGLTMTSKAKECDICMQEKVTTFCGDCNHYYCLKCSLAHSKIPSTRFHLVEKLLLKDENKGDANELVEEAENVNVYCDDCKEVVSLRVYASQHKKHKMQLVTDFMKLKKIQMDKEIAITKCKFSEIEAELHKIALKLLKCENVTNEVKMLIDERTKLLKHVIDSQAKMICKEVDKKAYSYVKKAVASKLQLNSLQQALEKKITKCENAANNLVTDDTDDILFGSWPINGILEEFVLSFKWNSDKDEAKIKEIFGSLIGELVFEMLMNRQIA